mgnify:CR=1 FL=1
MMQLDFERLRSMGLTPALANQAMACAAHMVLLADHERVRESSRGRGSHEVHALLPPDVIGLVVLLPRVD